MKLFLMLLPLLVLSGCDYVTQDDLSRYSSTLHSEIEECKLSVHIVDEKVNLVDSQVKSNFGMKDEPQVNIQPDNDIYCHEGNDIKIGDNVYFAFLGNRTNIEDNRSVVVDGVTVYYEVQPVVEILREMVEGKDCITVINGYGTDPKKTYSAMIKHIRLYLKSEGNK